MCLDLSEPLYAVYSLAPWCFWRTLALLCSAFMCIRFIHQVFLYAIGVFLWSVSFHLFPLPSTFSTFVNARHCIIEWSGKNPSIQKEVDEMDINCWQHHEWQGCWELKYPPLIFVASLHFHFSFRLSHSLGPAYPPFLLFPRNPFHIIKNA